MKRLTGEHHKDLSSGEGVLPTAPEIRPENPSAGNEIVIEVLNSLRVHYSKPDPG
jgi:hypothetical protein